MRRFAIVVTLLALVLPAILMAAPKDSPQRPDTKGVSAMPSYLRAVEPAVVGIHVEVPRDRPSVFTLGPERWGSGVIFDAKAGYAITVSYVLLDAERIEVLLRDGRKAAAKLVGLDLETGIGVIRLEGPGPWPAASFGESAKVAVGDVAGTIGVTDDGALVANPGKIEAVQPFIASWEYMLDRAFIVSPFNAAFGGAALVDVNGKVVGITSLRLGEAPHVNLAIPIEKFLKDKDELCDKGRVVSRRPRPWLGLYTIARDGGGVIVSGVSPIGPASAVGIKRGDVILRLNGERVTSQEDFYSRLWQGPMDQDVQLVVVRESAFQAVTVRPADRYRVFRTSDK